MLSGLTGNGVIPQSIPQSNNQAFLNQSPLSTSSQFSKPIFPASKGEFNEDDMYGLNHEMKRFSMNKNFKGNFNVSGNTSNNTISDDYLSMGHGSCSFFFFRFLPYRES